MTYEGANAKLDWAREHLTTIRRDIETLETRNGHTFSVQADLEASKYVFRVHDLKPIPPDLGLRIGDCLHAARCAIDYVMTMLVAMANEVAPVDVEDVQFPVYSEPKRFNGATGTLRTNRTMAGWLARIEELQPYNAGNPSIWGWISPRKRRGWKPLAAPPPQDPRFPRLPMGLDWLTRLDNIDKHRCVLPLMWGVRHPGGPIPNGPTKFRSFGGSLNMNPLEDGAEVETVVYDGIEPADWVPDQVYMQARFPLQILIHKFIEQNSTARVLDTCIWSAEMVLKIFEPVFVHAGAPDPVTISLD